MTIDLTDTNEDNFLCGFKIGNFCSQKINYQKEIGMTVTDVAFVILVTLLGIYLFHVCLLVLYDIVCI